MIYLLQLQKSKIHEEASDLGDTYKYQLFNNFISFVIVNARLRFFENPLAVDNTPSIQKKNTIIIFWGVKQILVWPNLYQKY